MLPPGLDMAAALMTSQQLCSPEQDEARKPRRCGEEAPKILPSQRGYRQLLVGGGGRFTYRWLLVCCPGSISMSVMGIQIEHHIVCNNSKKYTKLEDRLGTLGEQ